MTCGSVDTIKGNRTLLDVTGLDKTAHERLGGLRDGEISFMSYFNPSTTSGSEGAHTVLKALPLTDVIVSYVHQSTVGNPMASMIAKQVNYDPTRGADGSMTMKTQAMANGYGIQWFKQLTPGVTTHASSTTGTSIDEGASSSFGGTAVQHLVSLGSGTVTTVVQDSADNSTFAGISGLSFTAASARTSERIESTTETDTINRYVRVFTSGTFTNAVLVVGFHRHKVATTNG